MSRPIRRIVCGMSGGVDSAVAAYILKKKGYEVVGLFMKNWDTIDETGKCKADADREDAEYVCKALQIPLFEVNFVKEYWNEVFSNFIKDYESGATPNPDILCNQKIKFHHFINHAESHYEADAIATGHYARTSAGYNLDQVDPEIGVSLFRSEDLIKDQTFFLSQIPQIALRKTIFPLGNLFKSQVKAIASEIGLEKIAKKRESMGVCFIGKRNFQTFIDQYIEPKEGNFIDIDSGTIVGKHTGTHHFTLGQRSRICGSKLAGGKPLYVCDKNNETQEVFVAAGSDHPALFSQTFSTESITWINKPAVFNSSDDLHCSFKFQHTQPVTKCVVTPSNLGGNSVTLDIPFRALTRGQHAVFYNENECLGGGRITNRGKTFHELNIKERIDFPKHYDN